MKATILDYRDEGESTCYLCKLSLEEYIQSLDDTYQDYEIQRGIVSNVYLDTLVETVLGRRHIPPIVLVAENGHCSRREQDLRVDKFKILDGLQRTFRLQAIRKTITFCCENLDRQENYLEWSKFKFSRNFSNSLREINSNTDVLRAVASVFMEKGEAELLKSYSQNGQWFEIWKGLSPDAQVKKMLTLNAGHKAVKTRHQLELLFLNILPVLREGEGKDFTIVRERETSATRFSKDREPGHFHFAHIIAGMLSLYEGKAVGTSTDVIQDIQESDVGIEKYAKFTTPDFLKSVVTFLVGLDKQLSEQYGGNGILFMGREVSLSGLFGGIGAVSENCDRSRLDEMRRFLQIAKTNRGVLNLEQFEQVRNSVDLSKVNIGNVNRKAVYSAVSDLLTAKNPTRVDWRNYFRTAGV